MSENPGFKRAKKLLERYGGEVDDFFKFWPTDKTFFFSSDGHACLAYRAYRKVAVCTFDPIGPAVSVRQLLKEFSAFCTARHWQFVFVQTTDKYDSALARVGMKRLLIGSDAVIPIQEFNTKTIHNKYFRNIVNRFNKHGFTVRRHIPPHSPELLAALKEVSDDWLKLPHHEEWQFLTGRFDEEYLQACPLFVLRDQASAIQAFFTELPSFKSGVASIDLIRHRRDALSNSVDFLLIELMRQLELDGLTDFNLGLSPLAGQPFARSRVEHFIIWFYKTFQSFMRFKGLQQFKSKYHPNWEPRYLYSSGNVWQLPRIGWSIMRLMGRYRPEDVANKQSADLPVTAIEG
ncbi:MAG: bifunctional lysylphosphatidylglycerol flippase/synthetase MprF [Candidatus Saccharimonadales bacterium]